MDKKKDLELKKHVATIHSSNKLSLVQRKISNALLYNAYNDLLEKEEHSIHILTLCNLIGYDSKDFKAIKRALVELLSTVIEWNIVDGNKLTGEDIGQWSASSIIADASIDGPICTYSYSNKMKRLLYRPELYGRLNMAVQCKFKSSYGLALYENCIRYQDIGQTPWFDMAKFRRLMGVGEETYKKFRDFKSRVLSKAIEEVNAYSSITIQPQLRKQGRQPISIQFLITKNMIGSDAHKDETNLFAALRNRFSFSKKQALEVLENYQPEYILKKIQLIESSNSYQQGKIKNLAKYLLSAITEDYQPIKSSIKEAKINLGNKELEDNERKRIVERIKSKYAKYKEQLIDAALNKLENTEKEKFMDRFFAEHEEYIRTTIKIQRKKYSLDNITESPQIKVAIRAFAIRILPEINLVVPSIKQFISELSKIEREAWNEFTVNENELIQ